MIYCKLFNLFWLHNYFYIIIVDKKLLNLSFGNCLQNNANIFLMLPILNIIVAQSLIADAIYCATNCNAKHQLKSILQQK